MPQAITKIINGRAGKEFLLLNIGANKASIKIDTI